MKISLVAGVTATTPLTVDRERTIGCIGETTRVYATPMLVREARLAAKAQTAGIAVQIR